MPFSSARHRSGPSIPEGITGVILAGGKSSRYGANKALVEVGGIRLIERVVRVMESVFGRLVLITNTPDDYADLRLPMYADLVERIGPLGGIYTGLESISDPAGFFVACDMPFLNPGLIRHLALEGEDFDAVIPRVGWKIEPLHALYARSCLPSIRKALAAGKYQTRKIYRTIRVRYVEEQEIRVFDPQLRSFLNINRPEEMEILAAGEG